MKESCRRCDYYNAYYKMQMTDFVKLDHGQCSKHDEPRQQSQVCEFFSIDKKMNLRRRMLAYEAMERYLFAITELIQIIKENPSVDFEDK